MGLAVTILAIVALVVFVGLLVVVVVDDWREHRGYAIAAAVLLVVLVAGLARGLV